MKDYKLYAVYELGSWEHWGSLEDCQAYILANDFKDSFFTIREV